MASEALAVVPRQTELRVAILEPNNLTELQQLGQLMAQSGFFSDARQAGQACVKILAGREMGFPPIASMVGISILNGKPAIGSGLIAAALKRSGYTWKVSQRDADGCRLVMSFRGEELGPCEFTKQDAERAGLLGKDNFKKYPKSMYFARAITDAARTYAPEVLAGMPAYTAEELGAENTTEDGALIATQATPAEVAERRIAEEQAKAETRAIPELLRVPVGKLQVGEAAIVKPTFERLQDELLKTAGRDGGAVYDRITAALRDKFPKGTAIPADAMIDCWLTLYGECERLRAAKRNATQQPEPGASPTPTAAAEPAGRAEPEGPPAAIAALWGRMGDQEGIDTVLAELHADYLESLGAAEGEREYDAVAKLRTLPNKMNAPETARRFVRELVERLEHLKAQAAAKRIDDSDVPEIIGGKQQGTMFEDKREAAYAHD